MHLWIVAGILLSWALGATGSVQLTSFVAAPGDARATFTWSTAQEFGNLYFEFVRNGERTPQTTGHGTTYEPHNYLWVDSSLTNGVIYFYTLYCQSATLRDSLASVVIAPPHWVALDNPRAIPLEDRITVLWETYSEIGHGHFEIFRDGSLAASIAAHNRYTGTYYYAWHDSVADPEQPHTYTVWAVATDGRRDSLASADANSSAAGAGRSLPPEQWALAAWPNPFNPVTTLSFTLPRAGHVRLAVYDMLGREVRVLADGTVAAGEHTLAFDAAALPSGAYFARLQGTGLLLTRKLLLTK